MSNGYYVDESDTNCSITTKSTITSAIEVLISSNTIQQVKHFSIIFNKIISNLLENPLVGHEFNNSDEFYTVVNIINNSHNLLKLLGFEICDDIIKYNSCDHTLLAFAQECLIESINNTNTKLDNFVLNNEHFGANIYNYEDNSPTEQQYEKIEKTPSLPNNTTTIQQLINNTNNLSVNNTDDTLVNNNNNIIKQVNYDSVNINDSRPPEYINPNNNDVTHNDSKDNNPAMAVDSNSLFTDIDSKVAKLVEFGFTAKQAYYALKETKCNLNTATTLLCSGGVPNDEQLPDVIISPNSNNNSNHTNPTTNNNLNVNNYNPLSNNNIPQNNQISSNINSNISNEIGHHHEKKEVKTSSNSPSDLNNVCIHESNNAHESMLISLIELGFSRELCLDALERSNYNVERASNMLLTRSTSLQKQKSEDINDILARLDAEEREKRELQKLREEQESELTMERIARDELRTVQERKDQLKAQELADSENVRNYLLNELRNGKILSVQQHNYILAPNNHTSESIYSCAVCFCDYSIDEIVILDVCKHYLCLNCMKTYVNTQINDGRSSDLKCPNSDPPCNRLITYSEVQRIVEQKEFEKYQTFMLESHLKLDPNARWCPKPNCGVPVIGDAQTPMLRCPNEKCKYIYCFSCKVDWHQDFTCKQYQQWKIDNASSGDLFQEWQKKNTKPCPNCKAPIQVSLIFFHLHISCIIAAQLQISHNV